MTFDNIRTQCFLRTKNRLTAASSSENISEIVMEGSHPALPAEPGTLKATLPDIPQIGQMTERESAHPSSQQLETMTSSNGMSAVAPKTNEKSPQVEDTARLSEKVW